MTGRRRSPRCTMSTASSSLAPPLTLISKYIFIFIFFSASDHELRVFVFWSEQFRSPSISFPLPWLPPSVLCCFADDTFLRLHSDLDGDCLPLGAEHPLPSRRLWHWCCLLRPPLELESHTDLKKEQSNLFLRNNFARFVFY